MHIAYSPREEECLLLCHEIVRLLLFQLSLTLPIFNSDSFNIHIVIMDYAPCTIHHSPSHVANSISNIESILRISELSKHFEWLSISFPFWLDPYKNRFYVRSESFDFTFLNFALSVSSCSFRFGNNTFIDTMISSKVVGCWTRTEKQF